MSPFLSCGLDLEELDLAAHRRQVGTVVQENLLITGTIRENIALGESDPNPARVVDAARLAGASDFVEAMPNGYDTIVGELGLSLSGGQRQQISLARVLYRNPRILILDEPTSALDRVNREALWRNLPAIFSERAVFLIAHHAALDRHVDRILVLEEGIIVEEGDHRQLVKREGVYHDLFVHSVDT